MLIKYLNDNNSYCSSEVNKIKNDNHDEYFLVINFEYIIIVSTRYTLLIFCEIL